MRLNPYIICNIGLIIAWVILVAFVIISANLMNTQIVLIMICLCFVVDRIKDIVQYSLKESE